MVHRTIALGLSGLIIWSAGARAQEKADLPPVEVKLLEAGKQPRRALRYHFKAGSQESAVMDTKMDMAMEVNNQKLPTIPMPTMEMTMQADVKQAKGDTFNYTFSLTEGKVLDDVKLPDAVRKLMADNLAPASGWAARPR